MSDDSGDAVQAQEQEQEQQGPAGRAVKPMAGGLGGLAEAFSRAITQAARNKTMFGIKEHVIARQFRRQIAGPVVSMFDQARNAYAAAKRRQLERPGESLFSDVSPDQLETFIRNAEHAWFIYLLMAWLAAAIFAVGATRSGFYAINVMLGSAGAASFSVVLMLRATCDVWMMRQGKVLPLKEVVTNLDAMWCPLQPDHRLNSLSRFVVAPAVLLTAFSALPLMFFGG